MKKARLADSSRKKRKRAAQDSSSNGPHKVRRIDAPAEISAEDQEIAFLEKQLGFNNSSASRKRLAQEFEQDGFDEDFLGFLDELTGLEGKIRGDAPSEKEKEPQKPPLSESESESQSEDEQEEEEEEENEEEKEEEEEEDTTYIPKKDIYGKESSAKYVPPALRKSVDVDERLKRSILGLLNRVSDSNVDPISGELAKLFQGHSKQELSFVFAAAVLELTVTDGKVVLSVIRAITAVTAALQVLVGTIVGATLVERATARIASALKQWSSGTVGASKQSVICLCVLVGHLFMMEVIHAQLVVDIIRQLCTSAPKGEEERSLEVVLELLQLCGPELRREDPALLKESILTVQEAQAAVAEGTRMKFLLEQLHNLKNNKLTDVQLLDRERLTNFRKWLRSLCARTAQDTRLLRLRVSWDDLMDADTRGRWWMTGAAWKGGKLEEEGKEEAAKQSFLPPNLAAIADKRGIRHPLRRMVFGAVAGAADFADALDRIHRLGLKGIQSREVVRVLLDCCMWEASFNPYYAVLAQKVCEGDPSMKFTLRLSVWDLLKRVEDASDRGIYNLGRLLAVCVVKSVLSLSVFKVLDFTALHPRSVLLIKTVLLTLLQDKLLEDEQLSRVFTRITDPPKPKARKKKDSDAVEERGDEHEEIMALLGERETAERTVDKGSLLAKDGLALFLHTHMRECLKAKKGTPDQKQWLRVRFKVVQKALES